MTRAASARYVFAPSDSRAYVRIDWPASGVSANRIESVTPNSYTLSPDFSRTAASTSCAWRARDLYRVGRMRDQVGDSRVRLQEQVVDRFLQLAGRLHVKGEVALRVEIDEQDPLAEFRQRRPEVDGGGGLPDPPFLHRDGDRPGQDRCESNRNRRDRPSSSPRGPPLYNSPGL